MSDQQYKIETEMRLLALEYMLGRMYVLVLKSSGLSKTQIEEGLDQIATGSETQKFPGLTAVMHDHASDEYSRSIRRLTNLVKTMVSEA